MAAKLFKKALFPLGLIGVFVLLLGADLILKTYALGFLDHPLHVFSLPFGVEFLLERVVNQGAMWGSFARYASFLVFFRMGVVALLLTTLLFFTKRRSNALLLTLIITGAVGNIADTLAYGHVIDMLHFTFSGHSYGIFNLADLYIFIGCFGLIALSFVKGEKGHDQRSI